MRSLMLIPIFHHSNTGSNAPFIKRSRCWLWAVDRNIKLPALPLPAGHPLPVLRLPIKGASIRATNQARKQRALGDIPYLDANVAGGGHKPTSPCELAKGHQCTCFAISHSCVRYQDHVLLICANIEAAVGQRSMGTERWRNGSARRRRDSHIRRHATQHAHSCCRHASKGCFCVTGHSKPFTTACTFMVVDSGAGSTTI